MAPGQVEGQVGLLCTVCQGESVTRVVVLPVAASVEADKLYVYDSLHFIFF